MGTGKFTTYSGNDTLSLAWPECMGLYGEVVGETNTKTDLSQKEKVHIFTLMSITSLYK